MFAASWGLIKDTVNGFIEDDALSRGAAIAYYTIFSLAPVLVIVIAIAGLAFGEDAARGALADQIKGLMGPAAADAIQELVKNASRDRAGTLATAIGVGALIVAASGIFGEMQTALNAIWKADPRGTTIGRLVRARAVSLGLVASLGFLLMVSLVVSAALAALGHQLEAVMPNAAILVKAVNFLVSFLLIAVLFAAIYKILPDKQLQWRDVGIGALATALLFDIGKTLIGLYIGTSAIASSYGAAGALAVMLVWVYYSAQIFLLGAEFTRAFSARFGSDADRRKMKPVAGGGGEAKASIGQPG